MRALASIALLWLALAAQAQESYPSRPIRVIVPASPGGTNDVVTRAIGEKLAQQLGQTIVVDNRAGAGQVIGTELAARADPDGYTLLSTNMVHVLNASVYSKLPYDALRDFAPISLAGFTPSVMMVTAKLGITRVSELVERAKANPNQLSFGTPGNGTGGHLLGELLKQASGAPLLHVPYKGVGPAITDTVAGHVSIMFLLGPDAVPYARSGRLIPLAVAAPKRTPLLPGTPTFAEAGYPDVTLSAWYGFLAPAKTPAAVLAKLHAAVVQALADPELNARLERLLFEPQSSSAEEFAALMKRDLEHFTAVARRAGIKAD